MAHLTGFVKASHLLQEQEPKRAASTISSSGVSSPVVSRVPASSHVPSSVTSQSCVSLALESTRGDGSQPVVSNATAEPQPKKRKLSDQGTIAYFFKKYASYDEFVSVKLESSCNYRETKQKSGNESTAVEQSQSNQIPKAKVSTTLKLLIYCDIFNSKLQQ